MQYLCIRLTSHLQIISFSKYSILLQSLKALNKYFVKYKWRLILGIVFVTVSNLFAILPPGIVSNVLDEVYSNIKTYHLMGESPLAILKRADVIELVMYSGLLLILFAILRGLFMFLMRQTIIVMSRHVEYDQKNEIYHQYQRLNLSFYKTHATGDLMSRIAEDVSRVRMYVGPSIMYGINLITLTALCIYNMIRVSPSLSFYVLLPLPFMAIAVFYVNKIVNKKSEHIQAELSNVTSRAQETYSGIRVVKSFAQEEQMYKRFEDTSANYKKSAINLAFTEAIYFPSMNIFIGLSILLTILIGGYQAIHGQITPGNIAEFVMYITMLTFPISAIGFTANMIQRAAVSQRRINEFLDEEPTIVSPQNAISAPIKGNIKFDQVSFTYPNTGVTALKNINIDIKAGQKVAVIGKTGSGKSTLIHLLLRMYDVTSGSITVENHNVKDFDLHQLRSQLSYVPQEIFLFSDTISNNIAIDATIAADDQEGIERAAQLASVHHDIMGLSEQYNTMTGERGVMLSGGQKQRIAIARAIYQNKDVLILDDSLSAVDTKTETTIQQNLAQIMQNRTAIIITHRVFKHWDFDQIFVLDNGTIIEHGTHEALMEMNGEYAALYRYQTENENES